MQFSMLFLQLNAPFFYFDGMNVRWNEHGMMICCACVGNNNHMDNHVKQRRVSTRRVL